MPFVSSGPYKLVSVLKFTVSLAWANIAWLKSPSTVILAAGKRRFKTRTEMVNNLALHLRVRV